MKILNSIFIRIAQVLVVVVGLATPIYMVSDTVWALPGAAEPAPEHQARSDNARFVRVAGHHGAYGGGVMTWESEIVVDGTTLPEGRQIDLACNLSPETEVLRSVPDGAQAVRSDSGEVIGIQFPAGVFMNYSLRVTLRQPLEPPAALRPPLVAGRIIQRVTLEGVVYEPSAANAVPLHPGYRAQKRLTDEQIEWCEESLEELPAHTGVPIFLMPDVAFFSAGALGGELVDEQEHRHKRLWMIMAGFAALFVVLVVGFYLLGGRARHEEADAFLSRMS